MSDKSVTYLNEQFFFVSLVTQPIAAGRYVLTKRALGKYVRCSPIPMDNEQSDRNCETSPVAKRRFKERASEKNLSSEATTYVIPVPMSVGLASLRRQILSQVAGEPVQFSVQAANVRLVHLESIWTNFGKTWNRFVSSSATDCQMAVGNGCYVEAEGIYLQTKTQLLAHIDTFRPTPVPSTSETMHQIVQLTEPVKVPKFSGEEEHWGIYRQAFQATVQSNPRLNNSQKLLKLLDSLEGRAKQAVGSYWSTADDRNFDLAWNALCRQYDNEYGTIRAHLRKIHALEPLQEASCDGLRNVLDTVRGAQRQLQLLLTPEKVSEYFLLYHIESMLDPSSQSDWALKRTTTELPSLEKMYEYLEVKSATLAGMPRTLLVSKQPEEQRRHSVARGSAPTPIINRGRFSEDRPKCDLCPNQFHWPFKCAKFRALPLAERKAYVERHEMCFNCFSRKHETGKCPDRVCPRCNKHHNSLLCSANKNPLRKPLLKPEQVEDTAQ